MIGYKTSLIGEIHHQKIIEELAEKILYEYLNENCFSSVYEYKKDYHFSQNQLSALLSFFYNNNSVKINNFFKKFVNGKSNNKLIIKEDIPKKMKQYCYESGKILKPLVERRNKEIEFFNKLVITDYNDYKNQNIQKIEQNVFKKKKVNDSYLTTDLNLTPKVETILMIGKKSFPDLYYVKNTDSLEVHIMDSFGKYRNHIFQTRTNHDIIKFDEYCLLLGEKKMKNIMIYV